MAKQKRKVRIGVIGVGSLGSIHARLYSEMKEASFVGVCDIDKERLLQVSSAFKCDSFTDHTELFGLVDAVSIAVPTKLHFKMAQECLSNNINVLVEKPITANLHEADELLRLAKRKNLILQVGHVERFNSAVMAIKQFAKHPRFIECHRLGPFSKRIRDVGVVLDLMIHDIDIVLALVNSRPRAIEAVSVKILSRFEDIANARIIFKNGCVCNLTVSRVTPEVMRKIRIFEKDTYISLDYVKQSALLYKKHNGHISAKKINIKKEEPLKTQLSSFVHCVKNKKRPLVSGKEARDALDIALKILKKSHKR